jgi:hypothetical protein
MENRQDRRTNGVARFGNMNATYPAPHVERVVRTIRLGLPATAKAAALRTDASATNSKGSSLQIAAFFFNHPILTMLALWLITLIGFVCLFALPLR